MANQALKTKVDQLAKLNGVGQSFTDLPMVPVKQVRFESEETKEPMVVAGEKVNFSLKGSLEKESSSRERENAEINDKENVDGLYSPTKQYLSKLRKAQPLQKLD